MQVSKWGNSLAIRLPTSVVNGLKLQEGDDIEVIIADDNALAIRRKITPEQAIERLKQFQGMLPEGFKSDRDDANARK